MQPKQYNVLVGFDNYYEQIFEITAYSTHEAILLAFARSRDIFNKLTIISVSVKP